MDLLDRSGEIRCTVFNDLVDKFYDMIVVNKDSDNHFIVLFNHLNCISGRLRLFYK